MNAQPLIVPLLLPNGSAHEHGSHASSTGHILEHACSEATGTCLTSWDFDSTDPGASSIRGAALGCQDGSIFLFNSRLRTPVIDEPSSTVSVAGASRTSSPSPRTKRSHRSHSRPGTPSSALSPLSLSVAPRSRIVSGISSEQAQAPKNYVDFDEEEGKLKNMLKSSSTSGVRDVTMGDRLIPSFTERRLSVEKGERPVLHPNRSSSESAQANVRATEATSLLSAVQSTMTTPHSQNSPLPQSPTSPTPPSPYHMHLSSHVLLRDAGQGQSTVAALHHLGHGQLLAMQANGSLSLISDEDGTCFSRIDLNESNLRPPEGMKEIDHPPVCWRWERLRVFEANDCTYVFACAAFDFMTIPQLSLERNDHDDSRCSRVALLSVDNSTKHQIEGIEPVILLGAWSLDVNVHSLDLVHDKDGAVSFYYIDFNGQIVRHALSVLPLPLPVEGVNESKPTSSNLDISSLNPFKSTSSENVNVTEPVLAESRIQLQAAALLGSLGHPDIGGMRLRSVQTGQIQGLFWSSGQLFGFEHEGTTVSLSDKVCDCQDLEDAVFMESSGLWACMYPDHVEYFKAAHLDADGVEVLHKPGILSLQSLARVDAHHAQVMSIKPDTTIISSPISDKGRRKLEVYHSPADQRGHRQPRPETIWKANYDEQIGHASDRRITYILPYDLERFVLGFSDGTVGITSYHKMSRSPSLVCDTTCDTSLDGEITGLHVVDGESSAGRIIVGGADDGSVALWSFDTLKLLNRWTIFTTPLKDVVKLQREKGDPFTACLLCISQDGTIAVLDLIDHQFLFMIPGGLTPLSRMCLKGDSLLVIYSNGHARLWDARTREFRRALMVDKAEEVLLEGGWIQIPLVSEPAQTIDGPQSAGAGSRDAATTILLDVEAMCLRATRPTDSSANLNEASVGELHDVLAAVLTPGLNADVDHICRDKLHIEATSVTVGHFSQHSTSLLSAHGAREPWCVSEEVSAVRSLVIVALLRALGHIENDMSKVITFYTLHVGSAVGTGYKPPSLAYLARWWFNRSVDVRGAARALFDAAINNLSLEDTVSLVDSWQHHLPSLQPDVDKKSPTAALALLLCGYIAAHKYVLLSSGALNDVSKSIMLYLHDDDASLKATAVDLSSRGFHIWQQYIDAPTMLRSLVALATSTRKENITANVGPQARQAVLNIVTHHTGLFMTTISLDIMNPRDVEQRRSVMQLVAFLIRKRPLLIFPSIPRLVEAVVKSLDPNHNSDREAVLDSATEILGHIVQTFPTVDFHMASQKLAVGTSEGAIVMYDLKTGTRLYVLEGHKTRPSSISFSPDGRRLVTTAVDEGVVLVWKVGTSLTSFFYPGAPPRQGHAGSEPFKNIAYTVGDEAADMGPEESLTAVRFEWTAERSVRLKIRRITLTFST
ncbi:unnamed protein product [Peniophora sp. CBMAI 1063]|nr:unnamed protein product [Peniophora sp. CBMAI 1063]